jgi:hypothetical protein
MGQFISLFLSTIRSNAGLFASIEALSSRDRCLLKGVAFAGHINAKANLSDGRVGLDQFMRLHKAISRQPQARSQMRLDFATLAVTRYTVPHCTLCLEIVSMIQSSSQPAPSKC